MQKAIGWIVVMFLALGFLPSLTALSASLWELFPNIGKYFGPLNPLKFGFPIFIYFIWKNRASLPKKLCGFVGVSLLIGTGATLIAGIPCGFHPALIREWSVILIGCLSAFSFFLLSEKQQRSVLWAWFLVLYGSVVVDVFFPTILDWLLAHVFDPQTRKWDELETGRHVLTGIFGRQSLAKFLAWSPWLWLIFLAKRNSPLAGLGQDEHKKLLFFWMILLVSSAATLATSQRGPFVGAFAGLVFFSVHQVIKLHQRKALLYTAGSMVVGALLTFLLVPTDILETRLKSLVGIKQESKYAHKADVNRDFRIKMTKFSLEVISKKPFGHACISDNEFRQGGIINHFSHAHSLILQQFRERGWIWGFLHLWLWVLAFLRAWKTPSFLGSLIFSGIGTVLVLGLFDHPWFVLNHSMMLWIWILLGLGIPVLNSTNATSNR